MSNIMTYVSASRKIIFEPLQRQPEGFIEAKKWLNSIALQTGRFPEYVFNSDFCRKATQEEEDFYTGLKDRSIYALNAE